MTHCIFTSHHSIGKSILTLEKDKQIEANSPVSLLTLAKKDKMARVLLVETDFSGYWKAYDGAQEMGLQLCYGLELWAGNPEDIKSLSKVIVWLKNTQAYFSFISYYSNSATKNLRGSKKIIEWAELEKLVVENPKEVSISIPFYHSFLAQNSLELGCNIVPNLNKIRPNFFIENHDIPTDEMIGERVQRFAETSGLEVLNTHRVLYHLTSHAKAYMVARCLQKRTTWQKPNLDGFCSDQFSYESYIETNGK